MIAAATAPLLLAATNRKGWDRASPESTGLSVRRHAHGAQSSSDPPTCAPPPPLDAAAAKLLGRPACSSIRTDACESARAASISAVFPCSS